MSISMSSILVVAADSPARKTLIQRLETEGYLVVSAQTRAEAREILQGLVPGAVFLDLSMPRRQGRLLAGDLEQSGRLRMVPRLVLLGAWRRNTRPVGGSAAFVKPLDVEHVVRTLRTVYPAVAPLPVRRPPPALREPLAALLAS
jgi:CheY-like chemotaxis protein